MDKNKLTTYGMAAVGWVLAGIVGVSSIQQPNLLQNPDFEQPFNHVSTNGVTFGEIYVPHEWQPFYCDFPYVDAPCRAEFAGTKNPEDLLMGRPEYKIDFVRREHGITAGQWFCFQRTCDAGLYQVVQTTPGTTYTFTVRLHSWSAPEPPEDDEDGWGDFNSHWGNEDGKANSLFMLLVDLDGGTDVYKSGLPHTNWLGLKSNTIRSVDGISIQESNHMLEWVYESITFTAMGDRTTIFIRNLRLFPFPSNDSYVDDASLVVVNIPNTPTPSNTPIVCSTIVVVTQCSGITPTAVPTEQTPIPVEFVCPAGTNPPRDITTYVFADTGSTGLRQNIRDGAGYQFPVVGKLLRNQPVEILCTKVVSEDLWYMIKYDTTKLGWVLDLGNEY